MKKFISYLLIGAMLMIPFTASAAIKSDNKSTCLNKQTDSDGNITCTFAANITDTVPDKIEASLTTEGGAEVLSVVSANDNWNVKAEKADGTWNLVITKANPDTPTGEQNLYTYKYKPSGETNCKVHNSIDGQSFDTVPDEPTEPVKTGLPIPYVAVAGLAVIAGFAYMATKNKAKMYKI